MNIMNDDTIRAPRGDPSAIFSGELSDDVAPPSAELLLLRGASLADAAKAVS